MRRIAAVGIIMAALVGSAYAQVGTLTTAPIRMGSKLVRVGDSEAQVLATVGRAPDRETTLETGAGGAYGQRWIYIEPGYSGRTVTIELHNGKVVQLWSERIK